MNIKQVTSFRVVEEPGDWTRYTHLITFDEEGNCMVTKDLLASGGAGLKESLYINKNLIANLGCIIEALTPEIATNVVLERFYPYKEEENIYTVTSAIRCAYAIVRRLNND